MILRKVVTLLPVWSIKKKEIKKREFSLNNWQNKEKQRKIMCVNVLKPFLSLMDGYVT